MQQLCIYKTQHSSDFMLKIMTQQIWDYKINIVL